MATSVLDNVLNDRAASDAKAEREREAAIDALAAAVLDGKSAAKVAEMARAMSSEDVAAAQQKVEASKEVRRRHARAAAARAAGEKMHDITAFSEVLTAPLSNLATAIFYNGPRVYILAESNETQQRVFREDNDAKQAVRELAAVDHAALRGGAELSTAVEHIATGACKSLDAWRNRCVNLWKLSRLKINLATSDLQLREALDFSGGGRQPKTGPLADMFREELRADIERLEAEIAQLEAENATLAQSIDDNDSAVTAAINKFAG